LDARKIALVLVGNLDHEDVERRARELLRILPASSVSRPFGGDGPPAPDPLAEDVRRHVRRRTTQPEILVALPTNGIADDEIADYAVLRHILGGFQERLYTKIREERGFAYWVRIDGRALPTAGCLVVLTGARRNNISVI